MSFPLPTTVKPKVLIIAESLEGNGSDERCLRSVEDELRTSGAVVIFSPTWVDALLELRTHNDVGAVVIEWDFSGGLATPMGVTLDPDSIMDTDEPLSGLIVLTTARKHHYKIKRCARPIKSVEKHGYSLAFTRDTPVDACRHICAADSCEEFLRLVKIHRVKFWPSAMWMLQKIRERNRKLPVFLFTDKRADDRMPLDVLELIKGFIGKGEDTSAFITKRVLQAVEEYWFDIVPPFFRELVRYTRFSKYSWHTPGHMGGVAFLRSPPGKLFLDFFGENLMRADLSCSVPELGSLLEHSSVVGLAEANAARVFGAQHTFFVTNGTSTSNKMVYQSVVSAGDFVLLDRNSHKSSMQSIQQCNALPIYMKPVRNSLGILGPVPLSEFHPDEIMKKLAVTPYHDNVGKHPITLVVLTNSTYDGICYHVPSIIEKVADIAASPLGSVRKILFDEAWSAYAHFSPLFENYHAMGRTIFDPNPQNSAATSIYQTRSPAPSRPPSRPHSPTLQTAQPGSVNLAAAVAAAAVALSTQPGSPAIVPSANSPPPLNVSSNNITLQAPHSPAINAPVSAPVSTPAAHLAVIGSPEGNLLVKPPIMDSTKIPSVTPPIPNESALQRRLGNVPIFATQSTHKVLAALSQASMVHVRNVTQTHFAQHFNNAFMMNTSTSPQYSIIASLDVATAMMDISGRSLISDTMKEAISFRKKMHTMRVEYERRGDWFFSVWQPDNIQQAKSRDPAFWILPESSPNSWHGFPAITANSYLLDPLKVTLISRSYNKRKMPNVPAAVLAKFLGRKGVVVEKTGFFTVLVLFTIGVTRGKAGSLIIALHDFKRSYELNIPVIQLFPELEGRSPLYERTFGLRDLCEKLSPMMLEAECLDEMCVSLPECVVQPGEALARFVKNEIDWVHLDKLEKRVSAVLVVPYPPGIPTLMPGERFNANHVKLFTTYAKMWKMYPGFESEIHGVDHEGDHFVIPCFKTT